jgi:hypothetical protein
VGPFAIMTIIMPYLLHAKTGNKKIIYKGY